MIKSERNKVDTVTWRRLALGIFVFACLHVSAQPCLMAMDMAPAMGITENHPAPGGHHDHATHNEGDSVPAGCDHCPTGGVASSQTCLTSSASGCEILAATSHEGRQFKFKIKDLPQLAVMPAMPMALEYPPDTALLPSSGVEPSRYPGGASLNIRFCVYLI